MIPGLRSIGVHLARGVGLGLVVCICTRLLGVPYSALALLAACVALLWSMLLPPRPKSVKPAEIAPGAFCAQDLKRANEPQEPHLQAVIASSGRGIGYNNSASPLQFENELCKGSYLSLHRATYDEALNKTGEYAYGEYFLGKKRLWENRVQMQFKKPPLASDLYFGIQLESYVPMNRVTKGAMHTMISMLKRIIGDQLYHSVGDDPTHMKCDAELERPAFVMPLLAFDQIIVTPAGEKPPALTDSAIPSMGSTRANRVASFKREIEMMDFKVGETYTFCFWGISQFLDVIQWQIRGIPLITPLDMNDFCGKPPVHVVLYTLKDVPDDQHEERHLESRKNYYLDIAFWSSEKRPTPSRIAQLSGSSIVPQCEREAKKKQRAWWSKLRSLRSLTQACTIRVNKNEKQ